MSVRARLRAALGRPVGISEASRWLAYMRMVEPALAAEPRVHRFAAPPVIGSPSVRPEPLAVWIEPSGVDDGDEADRRTRAALQRATVSPAAILSARSLSEALAQTRAERVVLLRAGDEPAALALERLGQAAALAPDAAILTCDDDRLEPGGGRVDPHFRPGPSPDRWLALDDSGPLLVVARESAAALAASLGAGPGGSPGASLGAWMGAWMGAGVGGGSWRHALALGLAGPGAEGHAHVPLVLLHRGAGADGFEQPAGLAPEQLASLLGRWYPGACVELTAEGVRRVRWGVGSEPLVEVIVCLRDRPELLERCAGSLLALSTYERLSLALVDNGSVGPETAALLARLSADRRVRVLRDDGPFNFAALNNRAARSSEADVLVFLNNDTEVIDAGWIETLLEEALRPEIGAVAPLLIYPDGNVQHAGAALGLHGYAGHPFAGLAHDAVTPFGRADGGTRNWLAVTAACLMVERSKFLAVGGFDEEFVVAGNDVDLCLRLTGAGHRSLCVPHTVLIHDESRSRGTHIDPRDFVTSERSYGAFRTVGDPFYNPSLTLEATSCEVRVPAGASG